MKKNIISMLCAIVGLVLFANVARAADVTPPTTSVNQPSNNATVRGVVDVSCYSKDDVKVTNSEIYIDNVLKPATFTAYNNYTYYQWNTGSATAGSHTIYCKAYDAAGNVGISTMRTVIVDKTPDTTPPTIIGLYPANGEMVSGIYQFAANAADNYGVISKITLYIDGASIGAGIVNGKSFWVNKNTTQIANGTHNFYAVAVDPAGNTATSVKNTFNIYNEKPSATITSPANGVTLGDTFKITATAKATTNIQKLTFFVNGAQAGEDITAPYESSYDTRTQPNGTLLKIYARVYDTAGGQGDSPTINATVYNDASSWEVKIISPADGATLSGVVPIQTFSTNSSQTQLYVDGRNVVNLACASCSIKWNSATVADGVHTMYIDTMWNGTIYSSPVIAIATNNGKPDPGDTVNPTASLDFPTANYIFKTAGEWNFYATASDNTSIFKVEFYDGNKLLGSDPTYPYSYKWTISAADNGSHSIIAKAYDMKGNVGVSSAVPVTVNIPGGGDTVKPTVSLTAPTNNASYTSAQTVAINATASDNVGVTKVEFYDGTTLLGTDTTSPYSYNWAISAANNGTHSLTAKANDAAGNNTASAAVSVTVNIVAGDTTKPTVSITAPTNNASYTSAQTVAINATASDNVGVVRVDFYDGTTLLGTDTTSSYSYSWAITSANNGSHSLTAEVYDAAGNTKVSSAVNVMVNITAGCASNAACDDGIYCNGAETCQAGTCVKGTAVTCNDSNACTSDTCSESAKACSYVSLADNTACASGVCCAGTCKAGATSCSGSGTVCWNGSYQNLYANAVYMKKFCYCAMGTYSYKSFQISSGSRTAWYYVSPYYNTNWSANSLTAASAITSVTCNDGKAYPTNQTYIYPAPISATVNNDAAASQKSLDSLALMIQSIQASLAGILAQMGK